MSIQTALDNYKSLGNYFAPDYEQDNEVLTDFKKENPVLVKEQTNQLIEILDNSEDITEKYFVADLLYLFDNFDIELLTPMLRTAINFKDPSFNRIFLRPCINAFGTKIVSESLAENFSSGSLEERISISSLLYWLHPCDNGEAEALHRIILERANSTDNLIELYHYKLCYGSEIKHSDNIPNSAVELMKAINGNEEYETFLFSKLNWTKNGC